MAFDYAAIRNGSVIPLLARYGKAAILTQPGTPSGPVWDPVPGAATDNPVTIIETKINIKDRDGTLIQENDRMFLLSPDGAPDPAMNNTMTIDGEILRVINFQPIKPGNTLLLWRLQCRK